MSTIIDGEALTDDGVVIDRYFEVEEASFHLRASGPSFYNGYGKLRLRKANSAEIVDVSIDPSGGIGVVASQRSDLTAWLQVRDERMLVALGIAFAAPDVRHLVATLRTRGGRTRELARAR